MYCVKVGVRMSRSILHLGLLALCCAVTHGQSVDTSGCGTTKGCFSVPTDCTGSECDYIATWAVDGEGVNIELQGRSSGYVAFGFSADQDMGDDSVSECRWNNNQVSMLNSYNEANIKGTTTDLGTDGLTNMAGTYENGFISCSFTRSISNANAKVYNLDQPWYLLLAMGDLNNGAKSYHSQRTPSGSMVDVSTSVGGVENGGSSSALVRAHGILMMSAWTIFVCTAILLARYYKTGWPGTKLCDKMPVWFSIHRIFNSLVLLLTVTAFIIIFVDVKGWTEPFNTTARAHPIIGTIVTALAIINPVMAIFRPHPDGERRYLFNWAHWGVGILATILALVNTYLGMSLGRSETFMASWVKYCLAAFAGLYAIVVIVLEIDARLGKNKKESFEMQPAGDGPKQDGPSDSPPDPLFRYIVFGVYAVCGIALYLTMIIAMLVRQ